MSLKPAILRHIKRATKENQAAGVGEPYWYWEFPNGDKGYSKTRPPRSALTKSEFLQSVYKLQERLEGFLTREVPVFSSTEKAALLQVRALREIERLQYDIEEYWANMGVLQKMPIGRITKERMQMLKEWWHCIGKIDVRALGYEDAVKAMVAQEPGF